MRGSRRGRTNSSVRSVQLLRSVVRSRWACGCTARPDAPAQYHCRRPSMPNYDREHWDATRWRLCNRLLNVASAMLKSGATFNPSINLINGGESPRLRHRNQRRSGYLTRLLSVSNAQRRRDDHSLTKTRTELAGMTMTADAMNPCFGWPEASMPPPFPATKGFTDTTADPTACRHENNPSPRR